LSVRTSVVGFCCGDDDHRKLIQDRHLDERRRQAHPLFYLEVGVLCGLLAASYATPLQRAEFLGAFACASGVRFFGLTLAVRPFSRFFAAPGAARLFDRFSGAVMLVVATSLATTLLAGL
jgi:hypothetical protein